MTAKGSLLHLPMAEGVSLLFLASIFFITSSSVTRAQGTFQIGIGTPGYERGSSMRQLTDGGFIIGGYTESHGLPEADMLMIRTDASGNLVWSSTFGGPEREVINDVVQATDGGFIALAEKYQLNKTQGEFLTLLKTDGSGNLQWKKIYDEGGHETEGFAMAATPDGNYIITGIVRNLNAASDALFTMKSGGQSLFLLKIDINGNKIWSRKFSQAMGIISSTGVAITVTKDGSYLVGGNITRNDEEDGIEKNIESVSDDESRNLLLIKVNPDGSLQWAKEYAGNRVTAGFSVIEKREGGFAVTGICTPSQTNNIDYFVMSLAADGSVKWSKYFGGNKFDAVTDILQTRDGGLIVSGMTNSFGAGAGDALVFKTDHAGNLIWAKTYGTLSGEYGTRMALAQDGIVLTGEASVGKESFEVLLMKLDFEGNGGCWGKDASLTTGDYRVIARDIEKASTVGIEPGIVPPNFKRSDAGSIVQKSREVSVKKLCN